MQIGRGVGKMMLIKFGSHTGLFNYRCHNLEHEGAGMMRNFLARPDARISIEERLTK